MDQLRVFIAGAKELSSERNALSAVLMKLQNMFHIVIEAKDYKSFEDSVIEGGQQKSLYDNYISNEADIVTFILDSRVGVHTKGEFEVAYDSYIRNNRPIIFVYSNIDTKGENDSLKQFKQNLNMLNQYYIEYTNSNELERAFERSITDYLLNRFFKNRVRTSKEQIAFDLACQELSNILISCLNVIDEFVLILRGLLTCWEKYLNECEKSPVYEGLLISKSEFLRSQEHYFRQWSRVSKIFPPSNISITKESVELLASHIKGISEISFLESMYSTYFDDAINIFKAINVYLSNPSPSLIDRKMITLHFQGLSFLANAFFYTLLGYLSQLPERFQNNLKESLCRWQTYPKGISIALKYDEYERFAKIEFDAYERKLTELNAVVAVQEEQLDMFKYQINEIARIQQNISIKFCSHCGCNLNGIENYCPHCGTNYERL